jgi:hypothetical protein
VPVGAADAHLFHADENIARAGAWPWAIWVELQALTVVVLEERPHRGGRAAGATLNCVYLRYGRAGGDGGCGLCGDIDPWAARGGTLGCLGRVGGEAGCNRGHRSPFGWSTGDCGGRSIVGEVRVRINPAELLHRL